MVGHIIDFECVVGCVKRAINELYMHDQFLLQNDCSEWAISHRLAVYLEQQIKGWHIDCEYNRQGVSERPKTNLDGNNVRPDIVLHHRGYHQLEHNLLIIEIKKKEDANDRVKACEYTSPPTSEGKRPYQYQYGLTLSFFPELEWHWFSKGSEEGMNK